MNPDRNLLIVGLIVSAALYLYCTFTAALWTANGWAWRMALVSMGVTYVAYLAQIVPLGPRVCSALVILSVATGALAGLLLLG